MEEQKVLDESLGEVLCDKCDGSGWGRAEKQTVFPLPPPGIKIRYCKKCKGEGKLDWIENAVGKRPILVRPGVYTSHIDMTEFAPLEGVEKEIVNAMAEQMAADIDREIIESLMVDKEILGVK